jgi:peptidoglycan hydrolase-like protein with peptidoglycan-binding domain
MGPATEAGVRSYQKQHNLNATGQLDGDTLASLNLGGANTTLGCAQPNVSTEPASQSLGSNDIPLANRSTPADNATQPNTSTPH